MANNEVVLEDHSFIVSETDSRGVIRFANEEFCRVAGYELEELLGKPHNLIRHPDMPKAAFQDLWDTIKSGNIWTGYVKNRCKNGDFYWVYATVYPFVNCEGQEGYISCRRKASREEIAEHEALYKTMK